MDTEPVLGPYPRPRATVLRELRDTEHRRMMIRADWDEYLRQIERCRLQHRLCIEAIDALNAELNVVTITPLGDAP